MTEENLLELSLSILNYKRKDPLYIDVYDQDDQEYDNLDDSTIFEGVLYFEKMITIPFIFEKEQKLTLKFQSTFGTDLLSITIILSEIIAKMSQQEVTYQKDIILKEHSVGILHIRAERRSVTIESSEKYTVIDPKQDPKQVLKSIPKHVNVKNLKLSFKVTDFLFDEVYVFRIYNGVQFLTHYWETDIPQTDVQRYTNNSAKLPIKFVFLRAEKVIKEIVTNLDEMIKQKKVPEFLNLNVITKTQMVENPTYKSLVAEIEGQKRKIYKEYKSRFTFLDYVSSGIEIDLMFGIDFTISNGFPDMETSLHYIDKENKIENDYIKAINSVGRILEYYDHDKLFNVYGFGGVYNDKPSQCFPLSQEPVKGIDGVLEVYKKAIQTVSLSAPTNFTQIIQKAKEKASGSTNGYIVLIILTDGEISDLKKTKKEIIDACDLPLSIIIVGIGNSDFTSMEELDADDRPLKVDGVIADRDIVQFVNLKQSKNIKEDILKEIPQQIVTYYAKKQIVPKKHK